MRYWFLWLGIETVLFVVALMLSPAFLMYEILTKRISTLVLFAIIKVEGWVYGKTIV